ncbi:MAG: ATP-binding protein [Planctomycetota bacterium]
MGIPNRQLLKTTLIDGVVYAHNLDVCPDGTLVLATDHGVLSYDHERWTMSVHPNRWPCEAVQYVSESVVAVGFEDDFGFVDLDRREVGAFHSLRQKLEEVDLGFSEQILVKGDNVYFGYQFGVVIWDRSNPSDSEQGDVRFVPVPRASQADSYSLVNGEIIVGMRPGGLHRFNDEEFKCLMTGQESWVKYARQNTPPGPEIVDCCSFRDGTYLFASKVGFWLLEPESEPRPFKSEVSEALRGSRLIGLASVNDEQFIVSTGMGVTVFDVDGCILDEIGIGDGFQSVVGEPVIDDSVVWLPILGPGTLASFNLRDQIRTFDFKDGRLRWLQSFAGKQYVSVTDSVYRIDEVEHPRRFEYKLTPIIEGIGQSDSQVKTEKELLIATSGGLFALKEDETYYRIDYDGHNHGVLLPDGETVLMGSMLQGIRVYRRIDGIWQFARMLGESMHGATQIELDVEGGWIWCAARTPNWLVVPSRLPLAAVNAKPPLALQPEYFSPTSNHPFDRIGTWNGKIVFNSQDGLRCFDGTVFQPINQWLDEPLSEFDRVCGPMMLDKLGNLWTSSDDGVVIRLNSDGKVDTPMTLGDDRLLRKFVSREEDVGMLGNDNRVFQVPPDIPRGRSIDGVEITGVFTGTSRRRVVCFNSVTLPADSAPLEIRYTAGSMHRLSERAYQTRMVGLDEHWSQWTSDSSQLFRKLSPGNYEFEVRARGSDYRPTPIASIQITIASPWYQSRPAIAFYVVGGCVLVWGFIQWRIFNAHENTRVLETVVAERTEDLIEAQETLEEKVAQRTAALQSVNLRLVEQIDQRRAAEKQLRTREQQLTHVSRLSTLGEMVAGITHEIRQPLSSISNFAFASANAIDLDQSPSQLKQWNEQIVLQVKRADQIIQRLRRFSRRSLPELSEVCLNDLIHETLAMLRFELERDGVHVELHLCGEVPPLMLDRIQIEQVIVNVMRNACEAMQGIPHEDRVVFLSTKLRLDVDKKHSVVASIADRGDLTVDLDQMFDAFHTSKSDGMGLGLAISRSIVEDHGGMIWAERDSTGTQVFFSIPVEQQEFNRAARQGHHDFSI